MEVSSLLTPDDYSSCLGYLQQHEAQAEWANSADMLELPKRSPQRPQTMPEIGNFVSIPQRVDPQSPKIHSCYSLEYTSVSKRVGSASSSLFSFEMDVEKREPLESAIMEEYMDEIAADDEICSVDNVVTIVKCHNQWDPKKVAIVATK